MSPNLTSSLLDIQEKIKKSPPLLRTGVVTGVTGLIVEANGPNMGLGELCQLRSERDDYQEMAEVVGFRDQKILLMPLGPTDGLHAGCKVIAHHRALLPESDSSLLGRVLDGMGKPIDEGRFLPPCRKMNQPMPHALKRTRITKPMTTGIRAVDVFVPLGQGQRIGLFAGSGVGKSSLLGMIARGITADVIVVGLVGERGRELRDFIEKDLGQEGMKRCVIVVATSDQPAPMRVRCAFTATAIAEGYRDKGLNVLLLVDSVTRFAMAQREIGLAVGEPPATRGYTPSVFSLLPRLLERAGTSETGSITAIYTVLVEGDDFNEPITDSVRGILDGHIMLSRALANMNHYPAIDILDSVSRLSGDICSEHELNLAGQAREVLANYRKNEDLITIGAYPKNTNPAVDRAIALHEPLRKFLRQRSGEQTQREDAFKKLGELLR